MSIAQVEDVEAVLGRSVADGAETRRVGRLLDLVDPIIVGALPGLSLAPVVDDVVTIDGTYERTLRVPSWPMTAVASVKINGVTVDPSTYTPTGTGLTRKDRRGYWGGTGTTVEVTYSHGDESPDGRLVVVAAEMVRDAINNPGSVRSRSEQLGDHIESVTFAIPISGETVGLSLTDAHRRILNQFRVRATSTRVPVG